MSGLSPKSIANRHFVWRKFLMLSLITSLIFLGGCMYPDQMRKENQVEVKESILLVQQAIDSFQQAKGVLPIKTPSENTPLYEKYVIDFAQLIRGGYLGTIPSSAFEKGGNFLYAVVNVEIDPTVKLIDLIALQTVGDVQQLVNAYRTARDELPIQSDYYPGFYTLDYQLLRTEPKQIQSRYSSQYLGLMMREDGIVFIDYGMELMPLLQKKTQAQAEVPDDLREWLVEASYFVPTVSVPYALVNNEPIPQNELVE
jgi:hypothetical protein